MKLLIIFVLLVLPFARANEACFSYYPDRTRSNFSINSPKVQIFRNHNMMVKVLKLSQLTEHDPEFQLAHQYLDEFYPAILQKEIGFKEKIVTSNKALWSQMHLILIFEEGNLKKPIAGSAFITSRSLQEKLGFEDELNIDHLSILNKDFTPSTEVGRLSVDPQAINKRKVLDTMLSTLFLMHKATPEVSEIYIYTSRKLHQLYGIKGLHFDEIPSLSSTNYIHGSDIIAIFNNKSN